MGEESVKGSRRGSVKGLRRGVVKGWRRRVMKASSVSVPAVWRKGKWCV